MGLRGMTPRVDVMVAALGAVFGVVGCRRHTVAPTAGPVAIEMASVAPALVAPTLQPLSPQDLLPGEIVAFGLTMPIGTLPRFAGPESRIYYVDASMTRVMRYLQRRLVFSDGDIHPLGAILRGARVAETGPNAAIVVDVGVRDEGERTLVTVWNRTPSAPPAATIEDGLRAAGVDPRTGQALPQYNN